MNAFAHFVFGALAFGLGVPFVLGMGFVLLADEFKEFTIARTCFYISAVWICGEVLWWEHFSSLPLKITASVVCLVFVVVGVTLFWALRLTYRRESAVDQSDKSIEQNSTGNNSPNIVGNNNQVVINPDVSQKLDEIRNLLQSQADNLSPGKLLKKYPLGYVIFDLDYENKVIPYDSRKIIDEYDLDWTVVKFTKNTTTEIEIRLPDARLKNGTIALTNCLTGGIKRVGNLGGYMIGGLMVWGEILAIGPNGIVFLVGFSSAPRLPFKNS